MNAVRRFLLSAWLSYRALFTWLNPWGYISTRIVSPIVLTVLFGLLGRFAGTGTVRPVIGGSLLAVAVAAIYGVTLAVANERTFGTLEIRVATPEGLLTSLLGKAVPHVADGFLNAMLTLAVASAIFRLPFSLPDAGALMVAIVSVALSASGLGVFTAAVAVRTRDAFTAPNVADMLLMLLSGVFLDPSRLPLQIGDVSQVLPLRHGLDAALAAVEGTGLSWNLIAVELAIGLVWGALGYAFLRYMLWQARRRASLNLL